MDGLFGPVDVLDEVLEPTGVVVGAGLHLVRGRGRFLVGMLRRLGGLADHFVGDVGVAHPLIGEDDGEALVQERHLLQPTGHRLEVVGRGLEDFRIRPESDGRAGPLRRLTLHELAGLGVLVGLAPVVAVVVDLGFEPVRQRVDHGNADTVQTTGHRVGVGVELATRVQLGHDHFDGGDALGVHAGRDATAVVDDLDAPIGEQRDLDLRGVARHRLVDRVVDDLPDQVVQATLAGGADVHARAFANRLEAFQNRDGGGTVVLLARCRVGRARCVGVLGSHWSVALLTC